MIMNAKRKSTLEKFNSILSFKNYADNTIKVYLHYSNIFLSDFNKDIYHISQKEAAYYLINKKYTSISQQNQFISSIKKLYKYILKTKLKSFNIERPRKQNKLPIVINKDHLLTSIYSIKNIKHKSILALTYSVGLRVSEVLNIKLSDINRKDMIIFIRDSKFNKDRIVPMTKFILELLVEYYRKEKPKEYLFEGQLGCKYSASSCNKLVKKYIDVDKSMHKLRHSTATHLIDQGVDISSVQDLLGHNDISTTRIYIHTSTQKLHNLPLAI